MKTKTIIIITVIILALGTAGFFGYKLYKKYDDTELLQYEVEGFDFDLNLKTLAGVAAASKSIVSGWLGSDLKMKIRNQSDSNYTVNSLFVELFTLDGTLIASPIVVVDKFSIDSKKENNISIKYDISLAGLKHFAKQLGITGLGDYATIYKLLLKYYNDGKIGTSLILKGYISAENLPVNIPINETIEI